VGGKTGTSQVVSLDKAKNSKKYEHHAWFVAFAPSAQPQVALAVIVEHGGGGGAVAAPLVQRLLTVLFPVTPAPEKVAVAR
jgi:penicillin-binding protein 2